MYYTIFVSIQFQRHCSQHGVKNETFMTPKLVQQFKMKKFQLFIKPVSNVHKKTHSLLII